jgi:hypothetical protein
VACKRKAAAHGRLAVASSGRPEVRRRRAKRGSRAPKRAGREPKERGGHKELTEMLGTA